jgi:hypothetical protein
MAAIAQGKKAASFALEDGAGKRVSLADFKGKHVVRLFLSEGRHAGLYERGLRFRDLWKELQRAGVVVLGVRPTTPSRTRSSRASTSCRSRCSPIPTASSCRRGARTGEDDVRQEDHGRHPVDGVDRPDGVVRKHWRASGRRRSSIRRRSLEAIRADEYAASPRSAATSVGLRARIDATRGTI